jgi:hypothetical protein
MAFDACKFLDDLFSNPSAAPGSNAPPAVQELEDHRPERPTDPGNVRALHTPEAAPTATTPETEPDTDGPTTAASATPATITPETIAAIHRAFDYRPPTGEQILINIARSHAQRKLDATQGTVPLRSRSSPRNRPPGSR